MNIYCAKCKNKTPTTGLQQYLNKSGRAMVKGKCCKCKANKSQLISSKSGGFIFTIPMMAALAGVAGSLAGGASSIANAVNQKKSAEKLLVEKKRHNLKMEEKKKKGEGLYLKPYKGNGLYLRPYKK